MRYFIFSFSLVFLFLLSCNNKENGEETSNLPGTHQVVVSEILQTTNYTYLHATENEKKMWLAVPKMDANVGDTYYYEGGMLMENFASKELDRSFEKIWFLEGVRTTPEPAKKAHKIPAHNNKKKPVPENIELKQAEEGISIADLYANSASYKGKKVLVRGVVVKYNPAIMNRNWVHLQDGTKHKGKFDLTVTTDESVNLGDTILVEGNLALDKDFGYGYKYEILVEEAKVKK